MPRSGSSSCGATLLIEKIPACTASTRNTVRSPDLAVTVALTVTSKKASANFATSVAICTSSCGCTCSVKICGAFGISSDRSFTNSFSIWKRGCVCWGCCESVIVGLSDQGFQEWVELALALEGVEIVAAADVSLPDPDVRHAAAAAFLRHLRAP